MKPVFSTMSPVAVSGNHTTTGSRSMRSPGDSSRWASRNVYSSRFTHT